MDKEATDEEATDEEAMNEEAMDEEATDEEATDEEATDEEATDEEATDEEPMDEEATDKEATNEEATARGYLGGVSINNCTEILVSMYLCSKYQAKGLIDCRGEVTCRIHKNQDWFGIFWRSIDLCFEVLF